MADQTPIQFERLTPEEVRESGAFLPDLDGFTLWHKKVQCDYCAQPIVDRMVVFQKHNRSGITLMCIPCVVRLFKGIAG